MRLWLAAVAVLVCVACAACGGSEGAKVTARITGGEARERALAREILQKLSPSAVAAVRFLGYQHGPFRHWPGRRMDVTESTDNVVAGFEESVFAYSFALVARARHIPIGYVSLDIGNGLLDNDLASAPSHPIDGSVLHSFESRLRDAAKASGVPITVRELRPGPVALEVTVTPKQPVAFVKRDLARFHALWQHRPRGLLGSLFRVEDPSGAAAFATADSPSGSSVGGSLFPQCTTAPWPFAFSTPGRIHFPPCQG